MEIIETKYRGSKEYSLVYAELITASKYRGTLTYQEAAKLLGWSIVGQHMGTKIGHLLGEISEDEVGHNRPMLSAIVTTVEGFPGPGFFILARQLNKLDSTDKDKERSFWEREKKALYETWKVVLREKE
jgi:hypothetical protein